MGMSTNTTDGAVKGRAPESRAARITPRGVSSRCIVSSSSMPVIVSAARGSAALQADGAGHARQAQQSEHERPGADHGETDERQVAAEQRPGAQVWVPDIGWYMSNGQLPTRERH